VLTWLVVHVSVCMRVYVFSDVMIVGVLTWLFVHVSVCMRVYVCI
jgi:hypothetical protein